jgi:hypothetical protein
MNIRTRSDVHVATPQPKKSVSSVQIGQPRARAAASMGQSSGSRRANRSRLSFELAIHLASNQFHQTAQ